MIFRLTSNDFIIFLYLKSFAFRQQTLGPSLKTESDEHISFNGTVAAIRLDRGWERVCLDISADAGLNVPKDDDVSGVANRVRPDAEGNTVEYSTEAVIRV
jgi:hypothetical protein